MSSSTSEASAVSMPIAIIGIGVRFPGDGADPEGFWRMLCDARSARSEVPKSRYNIDGFYHPDSERLGVINSKHAHFLKQDFKVFDAPFFSITPKEAKAMDPGHRMLLECTYEGFENAGLTLEAVRGTKTSCYIGTFTGDFEGVMTRDNKGPSMYHATGMSSSLASNRLSWFYDLKGPSMTVDTACSSSLTAFHLACQSIRTGEAEMSVVGGSNLMFGPDMSVLLGAAKILSADGKSQMWDEKANGFSRGEGVGITILKPLDAALRDGDTIRSVVLASALNQDGRTPGISLPSSEAQHELIRTAYRQAGVDPTETNYVEAHGTGTAAGDPLEATAILKSFVGENRSSDLYVGSVKGNTGHLEGAAGIAGVIKATLVVERGLIPQQLWHETLNPAISLPDNVKVPKQLCAWPNSGPRRASVNSFGFGGANAHVVLEDAAHYLQRHGLKGRHNASVVNSVQTLLTNGNHVEAKKPKLFTISSSDREGVKRNIERISQYLESGADLKDPNFLESLAYTLGEKRTVLPWKTFAIASNVEDLSKSLAEAPAPVRSSDASASKIVWVFTGQGAQWAGMAKELSAYSTFNKTLQSCEQLILSYGSKWSLSEELNRSESESQLHKAEFSQPICTALQIALVDLLQQWGVTAAAVVGHSSGEIAAAYCSGLISKEAAMKIAWLRGQFATSIGNANLKGAMLAVSAGAESIKTQLESLTAGHAVAACLNSPKSCTVSGDAAAIDQLCDILSEGQIRFQKLKVEVAYHSPHMQVIKKAYASSLAEINMGGSTSHIPMFSSVTGTLVDPKSFDSMYWVENLVSPVNFDGAVRALLNHSQDKVRLVDKKTVVFAEVGPHSALRSYLLDIFNSEDKKSSPAYTTVLRRGYNALQTAISFIGDLYTNGCQISLRSINEIGFDVKMLTTLPPYAWNHSTSFWEESYLSKEYRLRESPRVDLLGFASPGVPNPEWRNYLKVSESPWIKEHCVQGNIIYPGAGLMIMAIEGARQTAASTETISAYELRDVQIVAALRVPDDDQGVEICVQFHPRRTGTKDAPSTSLKEFTVSSWSEESNQFITHCRGLISITYDSQLSDAMRREIRLDNQKHEEAFRAAQLKCQVPARNFIYDKVEAIGMSYGNTFRNVTDLYAGDEASWGVVNIPDTKAIMPSGFEYPHVIHPATLDSVLHLLFPSISGSEQAISEAVVPFAIDRLFISASIPSAPGIDLYGHSTAQKTSFTTWTSSISVSTQEWDSPLILMEGLRLASLGATESQVSEARAQCFETLWHEDVDLISNEKTKELVYERTLPNEDDDTVLDHLEFVCLVHMRRVLRWFGKAGETHIPQSGFFKLYYEWMQERMLEFDPLDENDARVEAQLQISKRKIVGSKSGEITVEMVDRIGDNLEKIFAKELEPLQVMLEGDLLYTFYRGAFGTSFNTNVAEYIGMIADKKPGLSILEIGAGTGGTTYHVLERLRNEDGTSKAKNYCFTDISPGFLAKAADRFSQDASIMEFKTLNIEEDPEKLGFAPESYDILVCANVLHATKSIAETLAHCHSLLKPGGRLVLSEVTIKRIFSGFIMGPLPGWWLGEDDGRKGGPLLDAEEWDVALKKAHFSGVDMDVRGDSEKSLEPVSLLVSTKPIVPALASASEFVILGGSTSATKELSSAIQKSFEEQGHKISTMPWNASGDLSNKYCICLEELERPILARLTDQDWDTFKQNVHSAKGLLWLSGGAAMDCPRPHGSLIVGLSRAIRNENANVSLATLDIEGFSTTDVVASSLAITKVAVSHSQGESLDHEFACRDGVVFIPRITKAQSLQKNLLKYESKGEAEQVLFKDSNRPLKLSIKTPGLLDTFQFVDDDVYHTPLQDDWIEIEVKAVGLNFKDVLVAMGHLNENKLGVDASGIVTRTGASVKDFQKGDRVMTSSCNTFASFVRFPAAGCIPMPANMTFEEGASMPLIYLTAQYALMTIGRMVAGESILIHAAAGGVGQAAIVVAQNAGAEIYATVGSEEKKALIMAEYGIPEDHIFSSRDLSFAKGIMRCTNGKGVDVVLNSLAGEALRLSWHCLAKFGRFLEIGKADLFANTGLDMQPFLENKIYAGVNLIDFENNPTPRAVALFKEVAQLIRDEKFKPVQPIQLFTFSEIEKAFRYMQTGKHSGKIVVKVDDKDIVTAVPATPVVRIKSDATYLLAGGLGGICREIGRWMAEKGAKNLVFISRSAAEGAENIAFIDGLKDTYGTNAIAYNCDVSDKASLQSVLDKCATLPPIRGLVTGAMVLRDTLFDEMTAAHVRTTVGPKVHGTWNLHELLPKDMDFFVMLSSLAGVMGHRGQGNYGAGNIFQDCFASHRRSQGLPAMTIDISYLLSVGFVAENDQYVDHIKSMGLKCMTNSDLHGLMATAMEGTQAHPAQVMIGLPSDEFQDSWYWIQDGKFAPLLNRAQGSNVTSGSNISLTEELMKAVDMSAASELISEAIVEKLARLMMVPASDIDPEKPLSTYGVDSLVAVEVRNWMAKDIMVDVSVFEIMANIPIKQLAVNLANKSKLLKKAEE